MKTDKFPVFVPPRPNLGPEPTTPRSVSPWLFAAIVLLALLVVFALMRRRVTRRRKATPDPAPASVDSVATARDRLIACAGNVREALAHRFGPEWRAKTTEEVKESPVLAESLGADAAARLLRILSAADCAKFADPEHSSDTEWEQYRPDCEAWITVFGIENGASSKRTGN